MEQRGKARIVHGFSERVSLHLHHIRDIKLDELAVVGLRGWGDVGDP